MGRLYSIRKVAAEVVDDLQANSEPVPEPLAIKSYTGKFLVRVPPDVHRNLAIEAAEAKVSLNRLVSAKLSNHA